MAIQELSCAWQCTGDMDQFQWFVDRFPGYHWVLGTGVDLDADRVGGEGVIEHRRRRFGNMILSRWPIESSYHLMLPKYGSVSALSVQRSAIEAVISTPVARFRFVSTHLAHLSAETRLPQVQALLQRHHSAFAAGWPVSGDLAGTDWQSDFRPTSVPRESVVMGGF